MLHRGIANAGAGAGAGASSAPKAGEQRVKRESTEELHETCARLKGQIALFVKCEQGERQTRASPTILGLHSLPAGGATGAFTEAARRRVLVWLGGVLDAQRAGLLASGMVGFDGEPIKAEDGSE